jgi:hypothetical protein
VGCVTAGAVWVRFQRARSPERVRPALAQLTPEQRLNWRMPPLTLLKPVVWNPATRLGMIVLRSYLVVSVVLLIVKAVQLSGA